MSPQHGLQILPYYHRGRPGVEHLPRQQLQGIASAGERSPRNEFIDLDTRRRYLEKSDRIHLLPKSGGAPKMVSRRLSDHLTAQRRGGKLLNLGSTEERRDDPSRLNDTGPYATNLPLSHGRTLRTVIPAGKRPTGLKRNGFERDHSPAGGALKRANPHLSKSQKKRLTDVAQTAVIEKRHHKKFSPTHGRRQNLVDTVTSSTRPKTAMKRIDFDGANLAAGTTRDMAANFAGQTADMDRTLPHEEKIKRWMRAAGAQLGLAQNNHFMAKNARALNRSKDLPSGTTLGADFDVPAQRFTSTDENGTEYYHWRPARGKQGRQWTRTYMSLLRKTRPVKPST